MKKSTILFLLILLMIFLTTAAYAQEEFIISPESSNIFVSYGSGIDLSSGFIICNSFSRLEYPHFQQIKMELQIFDGSWTPVDTWRESITDVNLNIWKTYPASPGSYRIKAIHSAAGEVFESFSRVLNVN